MSSIDALDGMQIKSLAGKLANFPATAVGPGGAVNLITSAGPPTLVAKKGTVCSDTTNGILYINTDGAATWIKVGLQT